MPTYLEISALRIQRYLSRWPTLAGRRGASAMLAEALVPAAVVDVLGDQADPNPEAGEVDGHLSLLVREGVDPEALARTLLDELGDRLPAAELSAVWGDGETYVDAYADALGPKRAGGDSLVTVPAVAEFPLARLCDRCGIDPAVVRLRRVGTLEWACRDCALRAPENVDERPGARLEQRLRDSFQGMGLPRTFDDLAALGLDDKRNHLATVLIDGNALGRFFRLVSETEPSAKRALSAGLSEATFRALVVASEAADRRAASAEQLPVIPHVLGGDDVLVSVPASLGWTFTMRFLESFQDEARKVVDEHAPELADRAPTASAGVVFAATSHPFSRCVALADDLLDRAKAVSRGDASTVLWIDVTADGEEAVLDRRPWTLAHLEHHAGALSALADPTELPRSARSSLAEALADPVPRVALARASVLQRRLSINGVDPFLADGDPGVLREAIDIARWWS